MWTYRIVAHVEGFHRISQFKKKYDSLPAAISLQSSVGRYLMNYLLSEVMFTSLYIYWDSPRLVLLEKIKF